MVLKTRAGYGGVTVEEGRDDAMEQHEVDEGRRKWRAARSTLAALGTPCWNGEFTCAQTTRVL